MNADQNRRRFALLIGFVALTAAAAAACTTQPDMPPAPLRQTLRVRELRGWLEDREHGRIARACLVLYRPGGVQKLRSLNAGSAGQFNFGPLAAGSYELVISDSHGLFRPVLLPVAVDRRRAAGAARVWLGMLSRRDASNNPFAIPPR